MKIPGRDHLRETYLTLWSSLHHYESAFVPWATGQKKKAVVEPDGHKQGGFGPCFCPE